jgi:hypothetical protein
MLQQGAAEDPELKLMATIWGPSSTKEKLKYLCAEPERLNSLRTWDPTHRLLLQEWRVKKDLDFRAIQTRDFVDGLEFGLCGEDSVKLGHPVARQLLATYVKVQNVLCHPAVGQGALTKPWSVLFMGELCQARLGTQGSCDGVAPTLDELNGVNRAALFGLYKYKVENADLSSYPMHKVLSEFCTKPPTTVEGKETGVEALGKDGSEASRVQTAPAVAPKAPEVSDFVKGEKVLICMKKKEFDGKEGVIDAVKTRKCTVWLPELEQFRDFEKINLQRPPEAAVLATAHPAGQEPPGQADDNTTAAGSSQQSGKRRKVGLAALFGEPTNDREA